MTQQFEARGVLARLKALLIVFGLVLTGLLIGIQVAPVASAATGANFIATGHDLDFHCTYDPVECSYLKIVVDKVRNGSALPVLSIDDGSTLTASLSRAGVTNVVAVNPATASIFNDTAFTSKSGAPLYSAIVVASSSNVTDITPTDSATINARAADFKTFFNAGGGILALSSANMAGYYDFVPISVIDVPVTPPFTVTTQGAAIGLTSEMANCCATHNSFATPAAPLVTLETDATGASEAIGAFGVSIGGGGFTPPTPTVTIDGGATATTRNKMPMLAGTSSAPSGSAVSVVIGGQTLTTTVTDTGTWMVMSAALAEGTYSVAVTVTDSDSAQAGSATQSLTVDSTPPAVTITGGSTKLTNDATPPISGTTDAAAGTDVTVTVAGQTLTTKVTDAGTWTVTPTTLSDGPHAVNATILDPAGNTGSADQTLTVDTSVPKVTIDGGAADLVNDSTPTITGTSTAAVGTTVTVTVGSQSLTTTVAVGGTWAVTSAALTDGPHTVTASVTNPAGTTGKATQTLTVDTTAPLVAIDGGATALTNDSTPSITGTTNAPEGTTVTVTVGAQRLTTTVTAKGTWTVTPTTLTDGVHTVTASITDEAGNVGTTTQAVTVDTRAPSVTVDGGAAVLTSDSTPPISGTSDAAPGTTVLVTVGEQRLTTTVTADGTWTVTPAQLTDGPTSVSVSISDLAGNTGTATQTLTIDTTAPAIAIDGGLTRLTNNPALPITGTTDAAPGTVVTVTVAGQTLTGAVTAAGDWTVTPTALTSGPHPVTVSITDEAGNTGTATQTVTVDTTLPLVTITGGSAVATNDTAATISGTAANVPPGTTVSVAVNDQILTTTVQPDGTWTVTPVALREGQYEITASVVSAAGNTGSASQALTVDTTAPSVAIDGGATLITNDTTPTISGTTDAPAGSAVAVVVAGQTLTTTVSASGTWTVTAAALGDGHYPIVATVTDPAGNAGTATQVLGIDSTVPTLIIKGGATVTTNTKVHVISGSTDAAPGTVVTVTVAGRKLAATVQPNSSWSVTLPSLPDGQYVITASVTGPSGNAATSVQSLTIDTTAPSVVFKGGQRLVTTGSPSVLGGTSNAPPGSKVTVTVGDQTMTTTVQADGTWSVRPHALAAGTYTVKARITDSAGNATTGIQTLVITAPPTPTSSGLTPTTSPTPTTTTATTSTVPVVTTVTPPPAGLAYTGTDIARPLSLAVITIAAGLSLLVFGRRRRRSSSIAVTATNGGGRTH